VIPTWRAPCSRQSVSTSFASARQWWATGTIFVWSDKVCSLHVSHRGTCSCSVTGFWIYGVCFEPRINSTAYQAGVSVSTNFFWMLSRHFRYRMFLNPWRLFKKYAVHALSYICLFLVFCGRWTSLVLVSVYRYPITEFRWSAQTDNHRFILHEHAVLKCTRVRVNGLGDRPQGTCHAARTTYLLYTGCARRFDVQDVFHLCRCHVESGSAQKLRHAKTAILLPHRSIPSRRSKCT